MSHDPVCHQLLRQIQAALLAEWDPIGIEEFPEAKDEYDSYAEPICEMLMGGASEPRLFDYLWWTETVHMGLRGDRQRTERFASRLIEIHQSSRR